MDVGAVLVRLMRDYGCLPAIKLAWNCQLSPCEPKDIPKISPSHLLRELDYTSEERQALLLEQHKSLKFTSNGFKISVEPSILAFQKYRAGEKFMTTVTVRNIDKTMQKISFRMAEDGPFVIDENSRKIGKFASGLITTVSVFFKPQDEEDYYHKLIIGVNGTRIAIPVIGFGARGILDFPDKINFGQLPVNYANSRLFTVLNIGTRPAKFVVNTIEPFGVTPTKGIVSPNAAINLTLSYKSKSLGCSKGFLRVKYETGEVVHVELEAEAVGEDITFSPLDVEFEDTFIGMVSTGRVTIRNNGPHKTKFLWKNYISSSSFLLSTRESTDLQHHHKDQIDGSGDHGSNAERDKHRLYSRGDSLGINKIIKSQKDAGDLHNEPLYADDTFRIEPLIGELQPQSSIDVLVWFNPMKPGMFVSEGFCQIEGLEERSEIRFIGRALGPKFKFGFDVLDAGNVVVGGGHTYEVPVTNLSQVEGTITFDGIVGMMDGVFEINPKTVTLSPGEFGAFFLYYLPQGKARSIFEEFRFKVNETNELMSISFKGKTTFPELRFSEDVLRFGEVSYGFPEKRQIVLMNGTMLSLDFCLAIEPDGNEQVLEAEDILNALRDQDFVFPIAPREFTIDPAMFTLEPKGFQRLTITMTAASYGNYSRKIAVRLGTDPEVLMTLPVEAKCLVPTLIKPDGPIFVNCVARYPCDGSFTIHNPSPLSAVYCCVPEKTDAVLLTSDDFLGIIKPQESTTIPFKATTKATGDCNAIIEFYVAGKCDPEIDLVVSCHSVSPFGALKIDRPQIDLGQRKVRVKATETFNVINSASIPIPFMFTLIKGGGMREVWEIEPETGTAEPHSETPIQVSVTLNEIGAHIAKFRFQIPGNSESTDIEATANGFGCAILFEPELDDGVVDFGYIFIHSPSILTYQLTNPGSLTKHLEWKFEGEDPPVNPNIYDSKKGKYKSIGELPLVRVPSKALRRKIKESAFEISPLKKVLNKEETFTLTIKAHSNVPKNAEMGFSLWVYAEMPHVADKQLQKRISRANIGRKTGRKVELNAKDQIYVPTLAQKIKVTAQFALPKLKFSKSSIEFKIEPNPTDYSNIYQDIITLTIENPCNSPLAVILHTASPFGVIEDKTTIEEWKHEFAPKEIVHLPLTFDISRLAKDSGLTSFTGTLDCIYEQHPKSDESIPLSGVLFFPTVTLERDEIDFGEVYNGTEQIQEFTVTNPGKFCISYKVYIVVDSIEMKVVTPTDAEPDNIQDMELLFTASGFDMYQQELLQIGGNQEAELRQSPAPCSEPEEDEDEEREEDTARCDEHKKRMRYFYDKFCRMKLMSFLGLRDTENEPNDELTYFHYYVEQPMTFGGVVASPNEVIDIVPVNGVIQARCSQKLTVVFYAQSNIHFEAKMCFSVENGASKFFTVKGKSIPPPNPYAYLNTSYDNC